MVAPVVTPSHGVKEMMQPCLTPAWWAGETHCLSLPFHRLSPPFTAVLLQQADSACCGWNGSTGSPSSSAQHSRGRANGGVGMGRQRTCGSVSYLCHDSTPWPTSTCQLTAAAGILHMDCSCKPWLTCTSLVLGVSLQLYWGLSIGVAAAVSRGPPGGN